MLRELRFALPVTPLEWEVGYRYSGAAVAGAEQAVLSFAQFSVNGVLGSQAEVRTRLSFLSKQRKRDVGKTVLTVSFPTIEAVTRLNDAEIGRVTVVACDLEDERENVFCLPEAELAQREVRCIDGALLHAEMTGSGTLYINSEVCGPGWKAAGGCRLYVLIRPSPRLTRAEAERFCDKATASLSRRVVRVLDTAETWGVMSLQQVAAVERHARNAALRGAAGKRVGPSHAHGDVPEIA